VHPVWREAAAKEPPLPSCTLNEPAATALPSTAVKPGKISTVLFCRHTVDAIHDVDYLRHRGSAWLRLSRRGNKISRPMKTAPSGGVPCA
jgi:hypothetical protein